VAAVRLLVAAHLGQLTSSCRDAMVLVASELASNAVSHARTPYIVELMVDGLARIEVTDGGLAGPQLRLVPGDALHGRGLSIVARLATRWGVTWLDDSKVVWAEVSLDS
jgi:anti-sigma regulatory factor (Ser/Thr protein kinase)